MFIIHLVMTISMTFVYVVLCVCVHVYVLFLVLFFCLLDLIQADDHFYCVILHFTWIPLYPFPSRVYLAYFQPLFYKQHCDKPPVQPLPVGKRSHLKWMAVSGGCAYSVSLQADKLLFQAAAPTGSPHKVMRLPVH